MNNWQRNILRELMGLCNQLGGSLDYTATHYNKLRDRQKGLMDCYHVVYGVLTDHPENEFREDDRKIAEKAIQQLRDLTMISYPDRSGELKQKYNL